jgi:hypothetical protein
MNADVEVESSYGDCVIQDRELDYLGYWGV